MRKVSAVLFFLIITASQAHSKDYKWYTGDERCKPPKDDGTYSAPYSAQDQPQEYPTFFGADKPGWSCSYQRDDGVHVQYGDSRTPQQQWLDIFGGAGDNNN